MGYSYLGTTKFYVRYVHFSAIFLWLLTPIIVSQITYSMFVDSLVPIWVSDETQMSRIILSKAMASKRVLAWLENNRPSSNGLKKYEVRLIWIKTKGSRDYSSYLPTLPQTLSFWCIRESAISTQTFSASRHHKAVKDRREKKLL